MKHHYRIISLVLMLMILVIGFAPDGGSVAYAHEGERTYTIMPQGNDSNCDYIAVANGVQNIGGDGEWAYWAARSLVPQQPRDFREAYYTLLGPNGSDRPFSVDNLGAAPEAFLGMYETLGYNAVFLESTPHTVDVEFARAIRDRLAANPEHTFAHLWITPRNYNPHSRVLHIAETNEQVSLLYPYHEVAAMAAPGSDHVIILDGLVGHPYTLSLHDLAYQLRGFNRVIVVSNNNGNERDHQWFQLQQQGQPYVSSPLGGVYLTAARAFWGSSYQNWGRAIGQPYRMSTDGTTRTILPGEYVHYERVTERSVSLALLGVQMGHDLVNAGALPPEELRIWEELALPEGIRLWVQGAFGSTDNFHHSFGKTITNEFWLSREQMQAYVLRGLPYEQIDHGASAGYLCVLTERALLVWDEQHGTSMIPLGRIYYEQLRRDM
jgi:hypothetical protein